MDFFPGLDYNRMKKGLDIISWDSYPFWHEQKDEGPAAVRTAASHNVMRSLKKAPFLLMESTPSAISWRPVNPLKRPGNAHACLYAGHRTRIGFCPLLPVAQGPRGI